MRSFVFAAGCVALAGCGGADPDAGATVYAANCATCHGADGAAGVTGAADLNVEIPEKTDAQIKDIVNNGFGDMAAVPVDGGDIDDLIAYLRETFGGGV